MIIQFGLPWRRVCIWVACCWLTLFVAREMSHAQQASGPTAVAASLDYYPLDAVVDSTGKAFVVDRNLPGVWQWQSGKLSVLFQASKKFRTPLNAARSIALDHQGQLLVGDTSTRDIYRVKPDGTAEPITGGEIGMPMDIAVKSDGTIYVADLELKMLLRIPAGSDQVEQVAPVNPRGVCVDSQDRVWVISQNPQQLQIVSDDGQSEIIVDHRVFEFPHQVVVNSAGEAFVSDGYRKAIWKVVQGTDPEIVVEGAPLDNPVGLALVDDQVLVVDPRSRQVLKLLDNKQLEVWFEVKQ